MNPKTDEYVQHKHSWVIDPMRHAIPGCRVLWCPECNVRVWETVPQVATVPDDSVQYRQLAPKPTPGGWVMFWLTAALLLGIAMLCCSCGEARQLNPGASTAYWEVPASALEAERPNMDSSLGIQFCLGRCFRDCSRIEVWSKAPEYVPAHEVAHLLDHLGGDVAEVRLRLGSGCPESVYAFLDACERYPRRYPHFQWQVLQNMYPDENVIRHTEILEALKGQP